MGALRLDMLPDDVLFIIFDYCDLRDLQRLNKICKRFYRIIHSNAVWQQHCKNFIVTNQVSDRFRQRCNRLLRPLYKFVISNNWKETQGKPRALLKQSQKSTPWLQLTSDMLWWSGKKMLYGFDRQELTHQESNIFSYDNIFLNNSKHIGKFILWRDYILNGNRHGSIIWHTKAPVKNIYNGWNKCVINKRLSIHSNSISALDATSNIIISAAGVEYAIIRVENSLDIYSLNTDNIVRKKSCDDEIVSLAINPLGTKMSAILKSEDMRSSYALKCLIDLEHDVEMEIIPHQYGEIRDMLWEDANTLLICGSRNIQKWDFRVNDIVKTWDHSIIKGPYCISSDYHNTMITGGGSSCALLWDQRMSCVVQLYSTPSMCMTTQFLYSKSPIYSLQFDSTKLYCATNRFLYELDFTKWQPMFNR